MVASGNISSDPLQRQNHNYAHSPKIIKSMVVSRRLTLCCTHSRLSSHGQYFPSSSSCGSIPRATGLLMQAIQLTDCPPNSNYKTFAAGTDSCNLASCSARSRSACSEGTDGPPASNEKVRLPEGCLSRHCTRTLATSSRDICPSGLPEDPSCAAKSIWCPSYLMTVLPDDLLAGATPQQPQ